MKSKPPFQLTAITGVSLPASLLLLSNCSLVQPPMSLPPTVDYVVPAPSPLDQSIPNNNSAPSKVQSADRPKVSGLAQALAAPASRQQLTSTLRPPADLRTDQNDTKPLGDSGSQRACSAEFDSALGGLQTFAVRFAMHQPAPGALTRAQTGFTSFLTAGDCKRYAQAAESAAVALTLIAFFAGENPLEVATTLPHHPYWLLGPLLFAISQCSADGDSVTKIRFAHILELGGARESSDALLEDTSANGRCEPLRQYARSQLDAL